MEFGKRIVTITNPDGSQSITEEGYHFGLNTVREETRMSIEISQNTLLTEVIKSLDLLKTDTPEINIRIIKDERGFPKFLQKTWVVYKRKVK
jgi:hypothetical protein